MKFRVTTAAVLAVVGIAAMPTLASAASEGVADTTVRKVVPVEMLLAQARPERNTESPARPERNADSPLKSKKKKVAKKGKKKKKAM